MIESLRFLDPLLVVSFEAMELPTGSLGWLLDFACAVRSLAELSALTNPRRRWTCDNSAFNIADSFSFALLQSSSRLIRFSIFLSFSVWLASFFSTSSVKKRVIWPSCLAWPFAFWWPLPQINYGSSRSSNNTSHLGSRVTIPNKRSKQATEVHRWREYKGNCEHDRETPAKSQTNAVLNIRESQ